MRSVLFDYITQRLWYFLVEVLGPPIDPIYKSEVVQAVFGLLDP